MYTYHADYITNNRYKYKASNSSIIDDRQLQHCDEAK